MESPQKLDFDSPSMLSAILEPQSVESPQKLDFDSPSMLSAMPAQAYLGVVDIKALQHLKQRLAHTSIDHSPHHFLEVSGTVGPSGPRGSIAWVDAHQGGDQLHQRLDLQIKQAKASAITQKTDGSGGWHWLPCKPLLYLQSNIQHSQC